jgi:membrane fusion protein
LIRPEAIEAAHPQLYGDVILQPGAGSRWVALAALAIVVAAGVLITQGTYTRRSTVTGQLLPEQGLIRVTTPQPGIVSEKTVREGQSVSAGQPLFVISNDRASGDLPAYQQAISGHIQARRESLEQELASIAQSEAAETQAIERRASSLRAERSQIQQQIALARERTQGTADALKRYQALQAQGVITRDQLLVREAENASTRERLVSLQRELLVAERELSQTQRDADALRAQNANRRAELQRAAIQAAQEYAEVEARRRVVIAAPATGTLTLVQADVGQSVDGQRPLAHVVPENATLVARLYVPSRSAGFVRPGTAVRLRYDAFPYQTFGQHAGTVEAVSRAAVGAEELGQARAVTSAAPETHVAVTVRLPAQQIAPGLPLTAGLRLEADLLQETRPLYQWILEPLYGLTARAGAP